MRQMVFVMVEGSVCGCVYGLCFLGREGFFVPIYDPTKIMIPFNLVFGVNIGNASMYVGVKIDHV